MFVAAVAIAVFEPADPAFALGHRIADHFGHIEFAVGIPGHRDRALHVRFAHHQPHTKRRVGQLKRIGRCAGRERTLRPTDGGCRRQG